ncbi:MAG: hypothetical protein JSU01_20860, partial [Bacteroidetes bacterium]|nr:hypothetical protein [Bacteroidota bacterium]
CERYRMDFFKERCLHVFKNFEYGDQADDEQVHYMTLGTTKPTNATGALSDVLKLAEEDPS